jgi:hypothetical protein
LPSLRSNVVDAGKVHLKVLTGLQTVNRGETKVTDAGLEHLRGLTSLHYSELWEYEGHGRGC